ncbi:MAG TPA: tetratricopeptide repeat protein [Pyrinomonadaceae bacterium]|nr:tetratricopeptide repeat protein [Pyrinomonadaceae bacterium]
MTFKPARALGRSPGRTSLLLTVAVLLAAASAPAAAQVGGRDDSGTGGSHTIQGRLVVPSGRRPELRLKVTLESSGFGSLYVFTDANGSFRFTSLRPGSYAVVVDGGDEFETVRETVTLEPATIQTRSGVVGTSFERPFTLQIYLRPKKSGAAGQAQPGVLNAALAGVPKPAAELYQKALDAARRHEPEKAVEHLRGALALYPQFRLALAELGAQYLRLKQPDKAAEALGGALKLAPEDGAVLLDYGIALYEQRQYEEAEAQFHKALKAGASPAPAHFYLGVILIKRRDLAEAETQLREAVEHGGGEVALAHYYLGGLYWNRREYQRAAEELETYLRLAPDAADAERVRSTIKELRSKR